MQVLLFCLKTVCSLFEETVFSWKERWFSAASSASAASAESFLQYEGRAGYENLTLNVKLSV